MGIHHESYELIRRKAAYPLLSKYGINRYELWLLCQLSALLCHLDKVLVGKQVLLSHITRNVREHGKISGYYIGIVRKQFAGTFEYVSRPGSESIGISDLGVRVLEDYSLLVDKLIEQYKASDKRVIGKAVSFTQCTTEGSYYRKSA